ncbi:murein L,D-transpeptidase [Xanthobacteraceae bacterium A53D]
MQRPLPWPSAGRVFARLMLGTVLAGGMLPAAMPGAALASGGEIPWPPAHVNIDPAAAAAVAASPAAEASSPEAPAEQAATEADPAAPHPEDTEKAAAAPATPAPDAEPAVAETPREPAAPTTSLTAAPPVPELSPLAEQVRQILAAPTLEGLGITRREQEAIRTFYAARQDAPVFVTDAGLTPAAKSAIARFAAAGEDGLDVSDYVVPNLSAHPDLPTLARAEIRLAASTLLYARHAQAGRFDPTRISAFLTPTRSFPDPVAVLDDVSKSADAGALLAAFNPTHDGYVKLKAKLAKASGSAAGPVPVLVPAGPSLRPGDVDARVSALRARLNAKGPAAERTTYDDALVRAVMDFQSAAGLNPDGIVGPGTLAALNRVETPAARRNDIIANMERWRWLPRELGEAHVIVNIPEYMVRVVKDGAPIHQTRVVVGTVKNQTPLLSHDMEYVVLNPYWNIPPGIARNEMLPKLQRDPYFLARQGMEVVRNGRVVDPGTVNWAAGTGGYSFRQPPGERNALGRIKFMFPNNHAVYLHDTPSKALFSRDMRAFSHGCIRVQNPLEFAEVVFNLGMPGQNWTEGRIGGMLGGKERYVTLKQHLPVHLVYFTTFVDDTGRLVSRDDVYGTNAKVKEMLQLDNDQKLAGRTSAVPR